MGQEAASDQPIFFKGAEGSYPVVVASDLSLEPNLFLPWIKGKQVMIVTSQSLSDLPRKIFQSLESEPNISQVDIHMIPDGDVNKSLSTVDSLWEALIRLGHYRDTTLIAVGGGVVGDLVGFAAACYMRGVDWINFPTTLLSQVDAAMGGKTAINHRLAKNMVGAFHAPKAVFSDLKFLDTLPDTEFLSGLAEVIKYGIALDSTFFAWLDQNIELILKKDPKVMLHMVRKCSSIKAQVVNEDFKETGGRALLNFGHTVGHAIETGMNYQLRHGYAVSIGMVAALKCSLDQGLSPQDFEKAVNLLKKSGLPTTMPDQMDAKSLLAIMERDKKNLSDAPMRMILLSSLGKANIVSDITPEKILKTLLYLGAE